MSTKVNPSTQEKTLCILTDYEELFIEGLAFEQDVSQLRRASARDWTVDAVFQLPGEDSQVVEGLEIAYLANTVDADSRTLNFYVRLPNQITKDRRGQGNRYVEWKYLTGQRLQLRVPVEEWPEQIVLPVEAVAREGAESFVFQQNGRHFDRISCAREVSRPVLGRDRERRFALFRETSLPCGVLIRCKWLSRTRRPVESIRTPGTTIREGAGCSTPSYASPSGIACWSSPWPCF